VFETSARHSVRLSHWCAGAHSRGGGFFLRRVRA
jgi:hypothetical protein